MEKVKTRNKAETKIKIIQATIDLLAKGGFTALGINKIAAEADIDKQLIYRYFGGIDGIIEHIAEDLGLWIGDQPKQKNYKNYAEMSQSLLAQYVQTLRKEKILKRIILWELSEDSDLMKKLEQSRSIVFAKWVAEMKRDLEPPDNVDAPAMNAILLAAMHYFAIRSDTLGRFAGIEMKTEADWQRIEKAANFIIEQIYKEKS
jgi:AcrR family transcriptional regulator